MKHCESVLMHQTSEQATGRANGSVLAIFPIGMQGKYQREMVDPIPPSSVFLDDVKAVSRARRGVKIAKVGMSLQRVDQCVPRRVGGSIACFNG